MLVLTRKLMEKLYIGDEICVTVVRLEGGQVRLGIDAPREISVVRAELMASRGHQPRVGVRAADGDPAAPVVPPPVARPPITTRPTSARGIDNRRRGPSQ